MFRLNVPIKYSKAQARKLISDTLDDKTISVQDRLNLQDQYKEYAKGGIVSKNTESNNMGLYSNINTKQERIKAGSKEKMRAPGSKGAPTDEAFKQSAKTAKMAVGGVTPKQTAKVAKVMAEFKAGELHSGKGGKVVKNPKQAIAISLSEAKIAKKK